MSDLDRQLDEALSRIHAIYGNDLEAFFRDAQAAAKAKPEGQPEAPEQASYHDRIMDIGGDSRPVNSYNNYTTGHRDARHAAAEIALEADSKIEELESGLNTAAAENLRLYSRITELEIQLKLANEKITDLRDANDRAVTIAAEEAAHERQRAELAESHLEAREALLSELEWGRRQQRAETQAAQLKAVLEQVEWVGNPEYGDTICPWCNMARGYGHKPNCIRQAALNGPQDKVKDEQEEAK